MLASARWRAWRKAGVFCFTARLRVPCRAGDFARRLGSAASQGLRDEQASSPTKHRAGSCRGLQDTCGARRQCTPPSAPCGASTSPCRGGCQSAAAPKASPVRGGGIASAMAEGCRTLALPIPFRAAARPPGGRERPPYNAGHTGGGAGTEAAARFGGTMRALPPAGGVSERSRYEVPALSAEIVHYGCRAGFCRALQDISAARRQCTPQAAPCGASSSPCRGAVPSGSCP